MSPEWVVRIGDLVARLGGDEFAVVLTPIVDPVEVEQMASRLMEEAQRPFQLSGRVIDAGISIGIAIVPPGQDSDSVVVGRSDLMQQADLALFEAKEAGRSTWRLFNPALRRRYLADQAFLDELRTAVAEEQFEVCYQPVIDMRSGRVSAFKALLRWCHPTRGLLAAGEFIPVAETSGLIVPLGAWVLHRGCRDAAGWPAAVRLLVNISPKQLGGRGLLETVRVALHAVDLPAARLELEMTETALLQASEAISSALRDLRQLGIKLALDDFGTGYSSLSHIRLFPFDTVKIDRSFVGDAVRRQDCAAIVRAISTLVYELGMTTIAEGVETEEQLAWLHTIGCDEVQGYLFERPRPSHDVPEMLRKAPSTWRLAGLRDGDEPGSRAG
ncbi:MAG: putative bifunctional diguanylate cyclase/phosphodiesterase [Janthinobacterium lividum]